MREEDLDASLRGAGVGVVELCETFKGCFLEKIFLASLANCQSGFFQFLG